MNDIFDKLINLIYVKKIEVKVNLDSKKICNFMPKIYYIGDGKSGSSSIMKGFPNINVAHWHGVVHFEAIYKTKLLSTNNYDLFDLIIYIGDKYNFKPIIIESIRNPINIGLSRIFQHIKYDRNHEKECEMCQIKKYKSDNNMNAIIDIVKKYIKSEINRKPYSYEMFKNHFNIDLTSSFNKELNYYFNDSTNVYLLFLKFEDINNWTKIINNKLPYKFILQHTNKTVDEFYEKTKKNIKYSKEELQPFLNCFKMTFFYSNDEINKLEKEFIIN